MIESYTPDDVHYLKPVSSLIEPLDMSKLYFTFSSLLDTHCDRFAVSNKKYMHLYMNIVNILKNTVSLTMLFIARQRTDFT